MGTTFISCSDRAAILGSSQGMLPLGRMLKSSQSHLDSWLRSLGQEWGERTFFLTTFKDVLSCLGFCLQLA